MNRTRLSWRTFFRAVSAPPNRWPPVRCWAETTGGAGGPQGNPLRIPPVWDGGTLTAAPASMEVWPGFPTTLLAINGAVPSPTIRVRKGQPFAARIENHLTDNLVIHWHGILAPPNMDGHPKDAVRPGQKYEVSFPILQRAGTYFYHPHTEPLTGKLVYLGLAGAFIVEDPAEQTLDFRTANTMSRC